MLHVNLLIYSCSGMWRCTWFHWMPAGPVHFTVVQRWSHSPRWVSTKASAFLSLRTPWRCALYSCPSARWDLRLRRNYWWVWKAEQLSRNSSLPWSSDSLMVDNEATAAQTLKTLKWNKEIVSCVLLQGTAQVSLADCEGSIEMVYHWLRVQMLSGTESQRPEQKSLSHRRHHDSQEDEQRPRTMVDTYCIHKHISCLCLHWHLSKVKMA